MRKILVAVTTLGLLAVAAPAAASTPSPSAGSQRSPSPAASAASPPPIAANDPLAQQLQAALQQQSQLEQTKGQLAGQIVSAGDQQNTLRDVVAANQKTIDQTMAKLAVAEKQYAEASARQAKEQTAADRARFNAEQDKQLLTLWLRHRYMSQDDFLSYVLSSNNFSDLMNRAAEVDQMVHQGRSLIDQISYDAAQAEHQERLAAADAAIAAAAAATLQKTQNDLQAAVQHEGELINQLDASTKAAAQDLQQANTQSAAVAQRVADLRIQELDREISAANAADWQAAQYWVQNHLGNFPVGPANGQPTGVRFIWPAPGSMLSQRYGPCNLPFEPPYAGFAHFHTGLDLAAPMGTPIYAAADGIVVLAQSSGVGFGNHVIIAHDTFTMTLYGHLQTMLVTVGQPVKKGDRIALMGSSGNSTGPHTHFEVHVAGQPVDPIPSLPPLQVGAPGPPAITGH